MGYYCEGDGGQSRGSIVTKVLIVDDDAGVLRMVGWVLRTEGFEVATATDGEEGLRKVEADLPDVIVTDLQMPVLDGEGLVSLAWAMMASGATTVVSAQWEASDKSTEILTRNFYSYYKQGNASAEALQKASLELIRNKSNDMHAPYYWANFTLNGDYR